MNAKTMKRMRFLSKIGKGSIIVSAVAGFALCAKSKYGNQNWSGRLHAATQAETDSQPEFNPNTVHGQWNTNWDSRENLATLTSDGTEVPTRKRHILLIRHGQYETRAEPDSERILTDKGRYQALLTGKRLNELQLPYTKIVSSTMSRAQETAELIRQCFQNPSMTVLHDEILEEGAPITPVPSMDNWKPHPCQIFQDSARIENAFRKYFYRAEPSQEEDSHEVIVCHANVIRFFVCRALQFPLSGWIRINLANCSLTMITIHPDGLVVVEMIGDHGHIPPENVTFF